MKNPAAKSIGHTKDSLLGRFFHSLVDDKVHWQGLVVAKLTDDTYLIQLLEWSMGKPSIERIVNLTDMKNWYFYSSQEEMVHSFESGAASKKRK